MTTKVVKFYKTDIYSAEMDNDMKNNENKKINIETGGIGYVKGYDMQNLTVKKIEKGKLGNILSDVVDINQLEDEIREALKNNCPVWGYFKKKQMWSCYIFEKVQISKDSITPAPQTNKDNLIMYRIKHMYIHPDAEQYSGQMMQSVFSCIKEYVWFGIENGNACDGFIIDEKSYVYKRTTNMGLPIGLCFMCCGLLLGLMMNNIGLGLCIGIGAGFSLNMAFSSGKVSEVHIIEKDSQIG